MRVVGRLSFALEHGRAGVVVQLGFEMRRLGALAVVGAQAEQRRHEGCRARRHISILCFWF